jgi:hypothetical protein
MANDKKFIVKNGLLTPENVVVGSNTDTGEKLQVTGTSKLSGTVSVSQSDFTKASLSVTNTGGYLFNAPIAEFKGDSDSLQITNTGVGDYKLVNSQQNNGIIFYDSTPGVRIIYNNSPRLDINSAGNRFYGLATTTIDNNRILTTADEGSGNGLDADTVDGLEAAQFVRSDVDDIMAGNYTIQQNLTVQGDFTVSGNTTYVNTEEILLSDNIITLNANYTGSTPTESAGIEIERGTLDNPQLLWDEANDYWKLINGNSTDLGRIITTADEGSGNGFDADTVDGLQASQFLRSDVDDTANGNITILGSLTVGDNVGGAQIFFDGGNNNRTLYSENGVIGFLNQAFNYSARSDAAGNWIVEKDVIAGEDVYAVDNVIAGDSVIANTGNISAVAGSVSAATTVTAGTDIVAGDNITATDGNITATAGNITATAGSVSAGTSVTAGTTVAAGTTVTAGTDVIGQRFVDADNNSYFVNPADTSTMADIGIDTDLFHNGNTNTKLSFNTDDISLQTGGVERLGIDNDSVDATVNVTAPNIGINDDLFHNGDTDTKLKFATDDISLQTGGVERLGIDNDSVDATVTVTAPSVGINDNLFHNGDTDTRVNFTTDTINLETAGATRLTANNIGVFVTNLTASANISGDKVYAITEMEAPIYYDADDRTYYGDFASTSRINNISLNGQIVHDGDTNTYIHFNAADSFQIVAGGNDIITANATTVVVDGDLEVTGNITATDATFTGDISANNITATTAMYAPIYYDSDNDTYYGDFAGTSVFNRISIDDYVTHNGDITTYFGFSGADTIVAATNNVVRLTINNTDFTSTLDGTFPNLYADRYYDADDSTYYMEPAATSRVNDVLLAGEIIHDGDTNTYLNFNGADSFEVVTGGAQRLEVTNTFVLANSQMRSPIFYDSDDTNYFGNFASESNMSSINIDDYIRHRGDTDTYMGFDAADTWGVWTAGTRRLTSNATALTSSAEVRAPRFVDSDNTSYYIDPANASLSATLNGAVRIGNIANNTRWSDNSGNGGISLLSYGDATATSNPTIAISGNNGSYPLMFLNRIDVGNNPYNDSNRIIQFNTDGVLKSKLSTDAIGNLYWILAAGLQQGTWDSNGSALLVVDEGGDVILGDSSATYTVSDNTSVTVGRVIADNKLHINGSIQLNGADDAIVFGTGTSSFLMNNELGFGQGGGFYMDEATTVKIRNNKALSTSGYMYASRFYDFDDNAYYVDPAGDSQLNTVDIDDYIRHRGDLNTYFGFEANDTFRVWTGGTQRFGVDNDSADFAVDIYAPRYYDSANTTFFAQPSETSLFKYLNVYSGLATGELNVGRSADQRIRQYVTDTIGYIQYWQDETDTSDHSLRFEILSSSTGTNTFQFNRPISMTGTGAAGYIFARRFVDADDNTYYIDPNGTSIINTIDLEGSIRHNGDTNTYIEFHAADQFRVVTGGTERLEVNDTATTGIRIDATADMRAPIFYDRDNTGYYVDPASTTVLNSVQALRYYFNHNTTYYADQASGDYGSIKVGGATGGWSGYAIEDWWTFMANGVDNAGIFNDTDNKWVLRATRNAATEIYFNGIVEAQTASGYFLANNQARAPIFYDSDNTAYYGNFAGDNTSTALRIGGVYDRLGFQASGDGNNNILLRAQDYSHWVWQTATNWGIFWAGNDNPYLSHFGTSNPNELVFIGNGNLRASIDLDNGNAYFGGEVSASNFLLNGGNENVSLNPAYGSGGADLVLFDGTEYFDKRVIIPLESNEVALTGTTSEFVRTTDGPFAGSYVLQTTAYRTFYSKFIPVAPGEDLYGEISVKRISGSGGLLYYGIERYDSQYRPITSNGGTTYFVVSGANVTSTNWVTYRNHTTIPTSHTPYNGSDGGGVYYVRIRILMNYNAGGALRQFAGIMLKRRNAESNLLVDDLQALDRIDAGGIIQSAASVRAPIFYDTNNTAYYLDPANSTTSANLLGDVLVNSGKIRVQAGSDSFVTYVEDDSTDSGRAQLLLQSSYSDLVVMSRHANANQHGSTITLATQSTSTSDFSKWVIGQGQYQLGANTLAFAYGVNQTNPHSTLGTSNANADMLIIDGGRVDATGQMRAPIFYDRNDTAFYADPAGTSIFSKLTLNSDGEALTINHPTSGGHSLIKLNSTVNIGSDMGFILLQDDSAEVPGSSTENLRMTVGVFNDFRQSTAHSDELWFQGGGRLCYNTGTWDSELNTLIGVPGGGTSFGGPIHEWRVNNATRLTLNSAGSLVATGDMRAPIYYDSNNTNYYVDPSSDTTSINIAGSLRHATHNRAGILTVANGSASTGASIAIQQETSEGWTAIFVDYEPNTGWGLYHDNPNNYFSFTSESSTGQIRTFTVPSRTSGNRTAREKFRIDQNNGDFITGRDGYANSSFRAPIFYDSNDTSYYLDPTGNTRLSILSFYLKKNWDSAQNADSGYANLGWRAMARGRKVYNDEEFFDGTNSTEIYNNAGGSALTRARLTGQADAPNESKVIYRYTRTTGSNGTTPGFGGFYFAVGTARNRTIVCVFRARMDVGRSFNFATNSIGNNGSSYWVTDNVGTGKWEEYAYVVRSGNSGSFSSTMFFYVTGGSATGTLFDLASATCYFDTDHSRLESRNYFASDSIQAPIYYDRNDTGYYLDPNSTGKSLNARGEIRTPSTWIAGTGSSGYRENIRLFDSGGVSVIGFSVPGETGTPVTSILGFSDRLETRFGSNWQTRVQNGFAIASGSYRAPIFYDSNNTGFYMDPNGTSNINSLSVSVINLPQNPVGQTYGSGVTTRPPSGIFQLVGNNDGWGIYGEAAATNQVRMVFELIDDIEEAYSDQWVFRNKRTYSPFDARNEFQISGTGIAQARSSLRAPIFYDSNDTAFYTDPNSTSRLNNLGVGLQASNGGKLSVTGGHGDSTIRVTTQGNQLGSGVTSSMHWWVSEPGVTWNEGGFGYNVNNDGGSPNGFSRPNTSYGQAYMRFTTGGSQVFYNTNTSGTRYENMSTRADNTVYVNNYLFAGNSLRAPIFYDTNDTNFYVDPNGTTRVNVTENIGRLGFSNYIVSRNNGGMMGDYNAAGTTSKCIWTIGESWPIGNMYGIGYQYGGFGPYGTQHQFVLRNNGTTFTQFGLAGNMHLIGSGNATGDFRAPIFYDSNDTGFYIDPNGRRSTNINGFSSRTKMTLGLTSKYQLYRADFTGDGNYWTGVMGWGRQDLNTVMTWGSGFFDTWSSPANQPSGTSHWVGVQAYHYTNAYNSGYGWQLAGGPIGNLRFRNSWPNNSSWTTVAMHDRNDGSGGALYAGIYYDSNNTGFYVDPNNTSILNQVRANAFFYNSDQTKKSNITEITNALYKIKHICGVEFDWNDTKKHDAGVVAQRVNEVFPVATSGTEGNMTVSTSAMIGLLSAAIAELTRKLEEKGII